MVDEKKLRERFERGIEKVPIRVEKLLSKGDSDSLWKAAAECFDHANALRYLGRMDEAKEWMRRAAIYHLKCHELQGDLSPDKTVNRGVYSTAGRTFAMAGDMESAEKYLRIANNLYERVIEEYKKHTEYPNTLDHIGITLNFIFLRQFDDAKRWIERLLKKKQGMKFPMEILLHNLSRGVVERDVELVDRAIEAIREEVERIEKDDPWRWDKFHYLLDVALEERQKLLEEKGTGG